MIKINQIIPILEWDGECGRANSPCSGVTSRVDINAGIGTFESSSTSIIIVLLHDTHCNADSLSKKNTKIKWRKSREPHQP